MKPVRCPFTIVVDVQEKQPFTFTGIAADANQKGRQIVVETIYKSLGVSHGDYSIEGLESEVAIERKSIEDAHGTFLGWGERRERFERELQALANFPCAVVVLECNLNEMVETAPSHGVKTAKENAKILFRQVLAWQQDYRVPWIFCNGRRMAEITTFRILERYYRKQREQKRKEQSIDKQLSLL